MKKSKTTQAEAKETTKKIDLDAFWKFLLSNFLQDGVALMHPVLYDAVDWTFEPVFIEQELINALKGRFKIKDKRKFADKLARLRLKSGQEYYIILHAEAQHEPEDDFNKRMYIYRCLIYLWSDIEDIAAIAIFTGAPPLRESLEYNHNFFNTETIYRFTNYIIAEQNEQELLESENPFAIAVLATLYTYQTVNDAERRFAFKRKVFELAQKKNIPIDKMAKLLTFVKDFMYLPEALEKEFEFESTSFSNFLKPNNTMYTPYPYREGTAQIISDFLFTNTGKTTAEWQAEAAVIEAQKRAFNAERRRAKQAETQVKRSETQRKQAEKKLEIQLEELEAIRKKVEAEREKAEAEREKAEVEREKAEVEREKAEVEREKADAEREKADAERENTIFNLFSKVSLSVELIASTLDLELEYVKAVVDKKTPKP